MTSSHIVGAVLAAVLLFWAVGAYNRLVRLRAAIVRQFVPVEEQFRLRHALLLQLVDNLGAMLTHAGPRIEALRAASGQSPDRVVAAVLGDADRFTAGTPAEDDTALPVVRARAG